MPTVAAADWARSLAKDYHWREGYSAMSVAQSWESAHPELPQEIGSILASSDDLVLANPWMVLAIPEYQVDLPGGSRPSQTDVLALVRSDAGLVAVAVEGKVDEPFGPTVGDRRDGPSQGLADRISWLEAQLGLASAPNDIRYQLLHRTVSALLVAHEFNASAAVMIVQSFSETDQWFDDFTAFARLFGVEAEIGKIKQINVPGDTPLYIGWCKGDQRFRKDLSHDES